ncbi:hypothetical protein DEJ13_15675 [Curtobacterium sp. MCLR17_007]|uniref:hypothetical protein n=1 Tax=Curtobacterium sp. MCLR17_007 TaxID=2175648 RepID=UPI0011B512EE|nr:hypothetical protein [Curtobacterium sp. MCLR17_007]WIB59860.1 hypothetical protein DEJ13_15675 [Curtobacterium sp. MCLR17_007]
MNKMFRDKQQLGLENARQKKVFRNRVVAIIILLLVVVAPVAILVGGPTLLIAYDKAHIIRIECKVSGAEASLGSTRSGKGIGSTANQVFIDSSCGELLLERGVTASNQNKIAHSFRAGERYEFEIGSASYSLREFLRAVHIARVVYGYESTQ